MASSTSNKIVEISYKRIFDNGTIFVTIALRQQGYRYGGVKAVENMKLENAKLISLDYTGKDDNTTFEQGGIFVLAYLLPGDRDEYDKLAAEYFTSHPKTREIRWTYDIEIDVLGRPSHEDFDL